MKNKRNYLPYLLLLILLVLFVSCEDENSSSDLFSIKVVDGEPVSWLDVSVINAGIKLPSYSRPVTSIQFQVSKRSFVQFSIYDLNNKMIMEYINEQNQPGQHSLNWSWDDDEVVNIGGTNLFRYELRTPDL